MTKLLVATPRDTLDILLKETDRRRLEGLADVTWLTTVTRNTPEDEYAGAIAAARAYLNNTEKCT